MPFLTAVLGLYRHSRCSFIDIGHIAADELRATNFEQQNVLDEREQMRFANVNSETDLRMRTHMLADMISTCASRMRTNVSTNVISKFA